MLGLSTAVAYVPLFWAILLVLLKTGAAPMFQLRYMWQRNGYLAPVLLIVLAALGHLVKPSPQCPQCPRHPKSPRRDSYATQQMLLLSPGVQMFPVRKSENPEVMRWVM